jgi:hypothetical protein
VTVTEAPAVQDDLLLTLEVPAPEPMLVEVTTAMSGGEPVLTAPTAEAVAPSNTIAAPVVAEVPASLPERASVASLRPSVAESVATSPPSPSQVSAKASTSTVSAAPPTAGNSHDPSLKASTLVTQQAKAGKRLNAVQESFLEASRTDAVEPMRALLRAPPAGVTVTTLLLAADDQRNTALHYACQRGSLEQAQCLMLAFRDHAIDPAPVLELTNADGLTPFLLACTTRDLPVIRYVLDNARGRQDLNMPRGDRLRTPLHIASFMGLVTTGEAPSVQRPLSSGA